MTYNCRYCIARRDSDGRLHKPNFWNGRTLEQFIQRIQCFYDNPTITRTEAEILSTIRDFGFDFAQYTIAPGGVKKMFAYLMSVRRLLVHGDKMSKSTLSTYEMLNDFDREALYESLAVVAADGLHSPGSAAHHMPATGLRRDNLQQDCKLCSGASLPNSATFRAHALGNKHMNAYFRLQTLCPTCGWSAVGRGAFEHMSGEKHRAKVMEVFVERQYIIAAAVVDSASQASPAKKHKA